MRTKEGDHFYERTSTLLKNTKKYSVLHCKENLVLCMLLFNIHVLLLLTISCYKLTIM